MKTIKQYVASEQYTGLCDFITVEKYENGKSQGYEIVADYDLDDYISALEDSGYTEAFDLSHYKAEMEKAKRAYEFAKKMYDMACEKPLYIGERVDKRTVL